MKRFTWLATAVTVVALAAPASAQMRVGIIGGATFANVSGDDVPDGTDNRTGFDVGLLAQFPLGMVLTFQPEAHYAVKGYAGDGGDVSATYIDVPLLLKGGTAMAEGLDVHVVAGPYVAFNVGCDVNPDGGDSFGCDEGIGGFDLKSMDYGVEVGGGFGWAMGSGEIMVDGRYQWGLADLVDEDPTPDVKNRTIKVLVGYTFTIGGMGGM